MASGEDHWVGKLNWMKVREIRSRSSELCPHCGEAPSNVRLARQFGISPPMIHKILRNKSWREENDPDREDG